MPPPTLSREQARLLDRRAVADYGLPSAVLMENAGRGLADWLCGRQPLGPVVVCCGAGNNGGDGLVLARHLELRGRAVRVLLFADPARLTGDAAMNFHVLAHSGIAWRPCSAGEVVGQLSPAAWVVDALLGTGARGEPRPPLDSVIDAINAQAAPVLAVDVPSGLDCDTGQAAQHTIRAAHTCTFVAPKSGFFAQGASRYTGAVHVLDIGAPRKLVCEVLGQDYRPPST